MMVEQNKKKESGLRWNLILVGFFTLVGTLVLISLGTWQWNRLIWKNNIITTIAERSSAPPTSFTKMKAIIDRHGPDQEKLEYLKVRLSGVFLNAHEHFYFTVSKRKPGWHVYTPFKMESGDILLVNKGFVPEAFKHRNKRPTGFLEGNVQIEGLVRVPPDKKASVFIPDNKPEKNTYHWRSLADMKRAGPAHLQNSYLPVMLDMLPYPGQNGRWPEAGTTVKNPPNSHLGYMLTWYGLSLALLLVSGFYMRATLKEENVSSD